MAINVEALTRQDPVMERYQAEVGATATGLLRTAVLSVPGVQDQVFGSSDKVYKQCFSETTSLSSLHFSLNLLLGGNGLTADVLKSARQIVEDTWTSGCAISDLAEADPNVASLMIDVKGEISNFIDDVLNREKET